MLTEGPSPSLKELVLDLSICVKAFRTILSGVRSPIIERIGVTTTLIDEEERSSGWVSAEWDEYLVELSKDANGGLFFAGFESLTQLLLPCDGISPETLVSYRPLRVLPAMLFVGHSYSFRTYSPLSWHMRPPFDIFTSALPVLPVED